MQRLEIIRTTVLNDYTTTAVASTVVEATYLTGGKENTVRAGEGQVLVLVVDQSERDLIPGAAYDVEDSFAVVPVKITRTGGPSAAPWIGAKEEEKASYFFRQALYVNRGTIDGEASVSTLLTGGSFNEKEADHISLHTLGTHFNGILAELIESDDAGNPGITTYTINDTPEDAVPTRSTVADSSAVFRDGSYMMQPSMSAETCSRKPVLQKRRPQQKNKKRAKESPLDLQQFKGLFYSCGLLRNSNGDIPNCFLNEVEK